MRSAKGLVLSLFLGTLGCGGNAAGSGDVAQNYLVEYDATQALTLVSASFSQDGGNLQLTTPAAVTANGTALTFNALNFATYPYTASVSGRVSVPIVFTDGQGRQYTNTIATTGVPTIAYPTDFTGFPPFGTVDFAWSGSAVAAGETVILRVKGAAGSVRDYSTSTVGATTVRVDAGEINGLSATQAALIRVTHPVLSQTTLAGGSLTVQYSTGFRTIAVTPI
ncbi:hypothetical protein BH11ARM2_BH11ARM2_12970 [soil metagenome]